MLYDPKWEQKTKADPFTLESLIAWLEKKPANEPYNYGCNGHCLLAQYFTEHGFHKVNMGATAFCHGTWGARTEVVLPPKLNEIAHDSPQNFGAALERARAAL